MRAKALIVACVVLGSGAVSAQGRVVSGMWTGSLGEGDKSSPVTVELRVDEKNAVTGRVTGPQIRPGDIKVGTFNPQTGALRFSVFVGGDDKSKIDFDGAIAKDTLTVQATGNGQVFAIKATRGGGAGVTTAARQTAQPRQPTDAAAAAALRSFLEVSGWVTAAANLVPADKYGYRPAATVRTFGQLVGHIADAYGYYCARAVGKNVQWSDAIEKGSADKATLVAKLQQSLKACNDTYAGSAEIGPLMENVAHTSLHYGNLVTYIRMLGLVPPSS